MKNQVNFSRGWAVFLLGWIAVVVCLFVRVMGFSMDWDRGMAHWLQTSTDVRVLPEWIFWVVSACLAYLVPLVLVNLDFQWQRVVLWLSGILLGLGAIPVMQLWGIVPTLALPFLALLVSGFASLVFRYSMARAKRQRVK